MVSLGFTWFHLVSCDSLGFNRFHLDSLGRTWSLLVSLGFTWFHLASLGPTLSHLVPLGLIWSHLVSLGLTRSHSVSLGLAWSHLVSFGLTWTHLVSLGLTWSHLVSQGKRENLPSRRGKGKGAPPQFHPISTLQPDRAHARTNERNETKRFPGWTHPPTSDLLKYKYAHMCICRASHFVLYNLKAMQNKIIS